MHALPLSVELTCAYLDRRYGVQLLSCCVNIRQYKLCLYHFSAFVYTIFCFMLCKNILNGCAYESSWVLRQEKFFFKIEKLLHYVAI